MQLIPLNEQESRRGCKVCRAFKLQRMYKYKMIGTNNCKPFALALKKMQVSKSIS